MSGWAFDSSTVEQTLKAAAAASVDTYEAAASAALELQWLAARSAMYEPVDALAHAWSDLSRDTISVQLSTTRWLLDL
jgi:hypothetical protein